MRVEQIAFPVIRQIAKRTRVAKVVFGLVGTENPFEPEFYIDPYPRINKLWEKGPVFYHGIHHCLGAALARMEMRIGLGAFIDAFGDYTIDSERVEWKKSGALRGPVVLPVRHRPGS
jgi:hypothetical protein